MSADRPRSGARQSCRTTGRGEDLVRAPKDRRACAPLLVLGALALLGCDRVLHYPTGPAPGADSVALDGSPDLSALDDAGGTPDGPCTADACGAPVEGPSLDPGFPKSSIFYFDSDIAQSQMFSTPAPGRLVVVQVTYCMPTTMAPFAVSCDGTPLELVRRQGVPRCGVDFWAAEFDRVLTGVHCEVSVPDRGDGMTLVYSFANGKLPAGVQPWGASNVAPVAAAIDTTGPRSYLLGGGMAWDYASLEAAPGSRILDWVRNSVGDVAWGVALDVWADAGTHTVGLAKPTTFGESHFAVIEILAR